MLLATGLSNCQQPLKLTTAGRIHDRLLGEHLMVQLPGHDWAHYLIYRSNVSGTSVFQQFFYNR